MRERERGRKRNREMGCGGGCVGGEKKAFENTERIHLLVLNAVIGGIFKCNRSYQFEQL